MQIGLLNGRALHLGCSLKEVRRFYKNGGNKELLLSSCDIAKALSFVEGLSEAATGGWLCRSIIKFGHVNER